MKRMLGRTTKWTIGLLCVLAVAAYTVMTWASTPVGVTATLIGRGTFERFKVKTDPQAPFDYMAQAKPAIDMVVRTTDYAPGASTGWHTHPGPVFITVTQGEVTFYEADDPTCSPTVIRAGEGYVDTGRGHIGRNESGNPAKDVAVVIAPVGAPFRSELPAPGPYCAF
jgi:hypothetical protein